MKEIKEFMAEIGIQDFGLPKEMENEAPDEEMIFEWKEGEYYQNEQNA